ncbi:DUF1491 family protein [Mesorhizobium sp. CAU 1741]|uniref:DUF1491 family protein n=1 Tax=Mesorhizobium sp. CAU 1741 TaxID=3140366 RepID=UPI00325BA406
MRVTTDFWVSSIVRRAFSEGGFAAIMRRGASEAGAVILLARGRTGESRLFMPAPQSNYEESRPVDRVFVEVLHSADEEEISKKIEREQKFDPDLWVVELEVGEATFEKLVTVMTP